MKSRKNSCKANHLIVLLILSVSKTFAQYDPMFTQYMNNEMYINPAYAGSRESVAATLLYRNQWVGIEGAPKTETFSIHTPIRNQKIGIGLNVMNEEIGVTHKLSFFANYAYRIKLGDGHFSLGLQGGIISQQERYLDIKTTDASDKKFSANSPNFILPNAGFGMYYYQEKYYIGVSIPRLLENKIDVSQSKPVTNTANSKNWHYFLTGAYVFNLTQDFKLKPSMMAKIVNGAPIEFDVNANLLVKDFWWIGAGYRSGDAITFLTSFQLTRQLRLGYSFDYTTSALQKYSSGTHEITVGYDFSFDKKRVITPRLF